MPKKETKSTKKNAAPKTDIGSAPELPLHIAKEYGLHHAAGDTVSAGATTDAALEDEKTEAAVDDIVSHEADELPASEDEKTKPVDKTPVKKFDRLRRFFRSWWDNKWARYGTFLALAVLVVLIAMLPATRYPILNTLGVRVSTSVIVLDQGTQLPLKNVTVSVDDKQTHTNIKGVATLKDLKLGKHEITIKRIAFATEKRPVTLGWGSNPLGKISLQATGTRYSVFVTDYLSGKPVTTAEGLSDEINAVADKKGKITLTAEDTTVTQLQVELQAGGYRTETITLDASSTTTPKVVLVPAQKEVFISKKSGKYDLFSIDIDGKNKQILLAGTGREDANIGLVVNADGSQAALVSRRDDVRNKDGYLLPALTLIDLTDGTTQTVDHSEEIKLVDWVGDRLVYRTIIAGASAANPERTRIIAYNAQTNARTQLATANYFTFTTSIDGVIYYAASSADPSVTNGLFKIKVDGTGRKRLTAQVVWTAIQTGYQTIALQGPSGWVKFDTETEKQTSGAAPDDFNVATFVQNPHSERSVWVDQRDGKGVLLLRDNGLQKDKVLVTQNGVSYPVRWAGDHAVIYRIAKSGEIADYAISPDGGLPHKLSDVTATQGYNGFYYY